VDVVLDQVAVLLACLVEELLADANLLAIAAAGGLVEDVQGGNDLAGGLQLLVQLDADLGDAGDRGLGQLAHLLQRPDQGAVGIGQVGVAA